jgi:hypothetical protein
MTYTRKEIREEWKELSGNPDLIYRKGRDLFKRRDVVKDLPTILSIDYIAKLFLEDISILDKIGINNDNLSHSGSFKGHSGKSNTSLRLKKYGEIKFGEKPFAMALCNSRHNFLFGKLFNYELPPEGTKSPKYGKIDLLSKINNEVYVIELKIGTYETLLCAIMEAFTFTKVLNIHKEKFIKDMNLSEKTIFRPAILILTLTNAKSSEHMKMLEEGKLNNLKTLIYEMNEYFSKLNVLPFKFFAIDADNPELIQDNEERILFKDPSFVRSKVIEYPY